MSNPARTLEEIAAEFEALNACSAHNFLIAMEKATELLRKENEGLKKAIEVKDNALEKAYPKLRFLCQYTEADLCTEALNL